MKKLNLYSYYNEVETEKIEETDQEHLTRMLYLRNFDTLRKAKEIENEIDVLRSTMETSTKRKKIGRVDRYRAAGKKRK